MRGDYGMYFSNLVDSLNGILVRNNGKSFPLMVNEVGNDAKVVLSNEKLYITEKVSANDVDVFDLKGEESVFNPRMKSFEPLTFGDVADTEENPLIVVATKGIKIYNDVPTFMQVLFVNENVMLASLIYGAVDFEMADGRFVPLQRCNDDDIERKGTYRYFSCSDLKENVFCQTKGGWDKSYEIVCPLYVNASNKGDKNTFTLRCVYDKAVLLNEKGIREREAYESKVAEEKRIAQEEAKKALEAKRKADRERVAKERAAEEEAKRKELEEKVNRKRKTKVITLDSGSATKRSAGAEAFLAMLNGD